MQSKYIKQIALGGLLAAVAVIIMCLGGMIPIATYICPMLCTMTQFIVFHYCGKRLSWAWFFVVCVLSLLLCPDKEAAFVFLAIGYYPLIKTRFDNSKTSILLKFIFFNSAIVLVYTMMIYLLGMQEIAAENMEFGLVGLAVILSMGNIVFFMLDKLLMITKRKLQ